MFTRRNFLRAALALPAAPWLARFQALAAPEAGKVKITAIKVIQIDFLGDGCLVKVETDAGLTGWGEAGASPAMTRSHINHFQRLLVGRDPLAIETHFFNMTAQQHPYMPNVPVISGIDIALWDLAGKILNQPIYRLLGGPFRDTMPMYSHGDFLKKMHDPASCRDWAQMVREAPEGFTAFKIGISQAFPIRGPYNRTLEPRELRQLTKGFTTLREAVGDDIDLGVHCHGEFDTTSSIGIAKAVEPVNPVFLEDPLNALYSEGWLALRRSTRIPILTGEKLELVRQFRPFLDNQAVDIIHPDISFAGGITGCRKIADYAALSRTPMALHNVGTLVRTFASAHLSAAVQNFYKSESRLGRPGRIYESMSTKTPAIVRNSQLQLPTGSGLGLEIDPEFMKKHMVGGEI